MSSTTSNNNNNSLSPLRRQREDTSNQDHQHQQPHHVITQPVFLQKILPYATNHRNSVATFKSVSSSWHETQVHYSGAILCWKAFIESGPRVIEKKEQDDETMSSQRNPYAAKVKTHVDLTSDFLHKYHTNEVIGQAQLEITETIVESTKILNSIDAVRALLYEKREHIDKAHIHPIFIPYLLRAAAGHGHFALFKQLFEISEKLDARSTLEFTRRESVQSHKDEDTARLHWIDALLSFRPPQYYDYDDDDDLTQGELLLVACRAPITSPAVSFILDRIKEVDDYDNKIEINKKGEISCPHYFMRESLSRPCLPLMVACLYSTVQTVKTIMGAICSVNDKDFQKQQLQAQYLSFSSKQQDPPEYSTCLNLACWREPSEETTKIINYLLETADELLDEDDDSNACLQFQLTSSDTCGHIPLFTALYRGQPPEVISSLISQFNRDDLYEHLFEKNNKKSSVLYRLNDSKHCNFVIHKNETYNAINFAVLFSPISTLKFLFEKLKDMFGMKSVLDLIREKPFSSQELEVASFDLYVNFDVTPFKCARTMEKLQFFVETFRQLGGDELLWQHLCYRSTKEGETVLMTICRIAKGVSAVTYLLDVIQEIGGTRFLRKQFEMKTKGGDSFWTHIVENDGKGKYASSSRINPKNGVVALLRIRSSRLPDDFSSKFIAQYYDDCLEAAAEVTDNKDANIDSSNSKNSPNENRRRERDQEQQTDRHNVMQDSFFLKKILPFASDLHYSAAIFKGVCTSWQHVQTRCDGAALCWKAFIEEELFPENPDRAASILISFLCTRAEISRKFGHSQRNFVDSSIPVSDLSPSVFRAEDYTTNLYHTAVAKEILGACTLMEKCPADPDYDNLETAERILRYRDSKSGRTPFSQVCTSMNLFGFTLLMNSAQKCGGDELEMRMFGGDLFECDTRPLVDVVDSDSYQHEQFVARKFIEKVFERFDQLENTDSKRSFLRKQLDIYCGTEFRSLLGKVVLHGLLSDGKDIIRNLKVEEEEEEEERRYYEDTFGYSTLKLLVDKLVEIGEYEKQYEECVEFDGATFQQYLTACGFGEDFIASIRKSKENTDSTNNSDK